ncbi:tRNA (adenosine(37)-N6)-threonylcarbamoyltransferase complex transferase subunit TsaD [Candidatus Similichlamydia epinepheli]|uniref:tRNA (adenosine(37)-N6)-threonylcarbamoyltransferase complex transferase subunit TsaD n=1 Tax=Candidatus Similichlamydia epinepheli TaxID=1903953 RepID=UPI000D3C096B|nr:tRNA (adenosine(37)-N6)-threonylcarbamoyltransferase complex transferase subunit TsaD [Candidatus Similichlamydia epinepheli]
MLVGIETTCDETAISLLEPPLKVIDHQIYSQLEVHKKKKGVIPEVAARLHLEQLLPIFHQSIQVAGLKLDDIDAVAVARGPGLIGSLLVGMSFAKTLALTLEKPLVCVNHVEAHLYASLMSCGKTNIEKGIGVVLSGGHTFFCLIHSIGEYTYLGETVDDAMGEAFDKVAIMLGLSYPGGALVEQLALKGDENRFPFRGGQVDPYNVSFSGLKTAVLYKIRELERNAPLSDQDRFDLAASFQRSACNLIRITLLKICATYSMGSLVLGGGVTANTYLRRLLLGELGCKLDIYFPHPELSTDNAIMIAGLGASQLKRNGPSSPDSRSDPILRLTG